MVQGGGKMVGTALKETFIVKKLTFIVKSNDKSILALLHQKILNSTEFIWREKYRWKHLGEIWPFLGKRPNKRSKDLIGPWKRSLAHEKTTGT